MANAIVIRQGTVIDIINFADVASVRVCDPEYLSCDLNYWSVWIQFSDDKRRSMALCAETEEKANKLLNNIWAILRSENVEIANLTAIVKA